MTSLVCIDTKIGTVRRYVREKGCGLNDVRVTHQFVFPDWPEFLAGRQSLDRCAVFRYRTEPEAFYT